MCHVIIQQMPRVWWCFFTVKNVRFKLFGSGNDINLCACSANIFLFLTVLISANSANAAAAVAQTAIMQAQAAKNIAAVC